MSVARARPLGVLAETTAARRRAARDRPAVARENPRCRRGGVRRTRRRFRRRTGGFRCQRLLGNDVLPEAPALCPAGKGSPPTMKRALAQGVLIVIVVAVAFVMIGVIRGMKP